MSTVDSTQSLSTQGTTLSTQGTTITPASDGLGETQFLTLMMDQLKAQDPLSPDDPTQFLSELANFSSLEQENSISASSQQTASEQASAAALGLLGKSVSYTDSTGATQTGTVNKVDFTQSGPELTIGTATGIGLSSVTEVS